LKLRRRRRRRRRRLPQRTLVIKVVESVDANVARLSGGVYTAPNDRPAGRAGEPTDSTDNFGRPSVAHARGPAQAFCPFVVV